MPTSLSMAIPMPPPPPINSSITDKDKDDTVKEEPSKNMFAGFKEYYSKFYEEFKKNKDDNQPTQQVTILPPKNEEVIVEEQYVQPYGEWEDVDEEEEAEKNAPAVLVEDNFTSNDKYFQRRKPVKSNYSDSDEEVDSTLKSLESKDYTEKPLFSDDEDEDVKKPVVFKKRKRKPSTNMRKRRAISVADLEN